MPSDEDDEQRRRNDDEDEKKKKKRKKDKRKEKKKKRSKSDASMTDDDDVYLKRSDKEVSVDDKCNGVKPSAVEEKRHKKRIRSDSVVSKSSVEVSLSKRNKIMDDAIPTVRSDATKNDDNSDNDICRPIVESSNLDYAPGKKGMEVTLLLFYQYQEPPWSDREYKHALQHAQHLGEQAGINGRMRVAKEGFNCTLTGSRDAILTFCRSLRAWKPDLFRSTEFKLTNHLPTSQAFKDLKIIPVQELVHYGLEGSKAPPITDYHGQHLEPADYHKKMTEADTVMIDVRNHYEAQIGRFDPPAAEWVDPNMRKSTEFPVWLDDPQTREKLRGKQVLMYCTGGIRCERATALLKYKMEKDPSVKDLGIKGVFQLQGGIDKYFKEFPDGGYWKGKNYVFDKRFAHKPPAQDALPEDAVTPLSKCEACNEPWDNFRGKRRCPTCGVPSLICRSCWQEDQDGTKLLDPSVRCDLCREQNIRSKRELRAKEIQQIQEYEKRMQSQGLLEPTISAGASLKKAPPVTENPDQITRLSMRNLCRKQTTEESLLEHFPEITHIVWRMDHRTQQFLGQAWVEMKTPDAAAQAVARSGEVIFKRPVQITYQAPNGKDIWPPPNCSVGVGR